MRLVILSDTHESHRQVSVPDGDVLIHCGDYTYNGSATAKGDFRAWFDSLPHKRKLYIPGNHDFNEATFPSDKYDELNYRRTDYLFDSGLTIAGVKFWGSSWTPRFGDWAFMLERGEQIRDRWDQIPSDTDVLITHGPPKGILDRPHGRYWNVGCQDLADKVFQVKPKIHCFGHVHGDYGMKEFNGTIFINASVVGEDYKVRNPPVVIDL